MTRTGHRAGENLFELHEVVVKRSGSVTLTIDDLRCSAENPVVIGPNGPEKHPAAGVEPPAAARERANFIAGADRDRGELAYWRK
jgi:hypothetical protein